jgi:hypothetical protein
MAKIAEHHPEEDWDGCEHEDGGYDFVVFGNGEYFGHCVHFEKAVQSRHDCSVLDFGRLEGEYCCGKLREGLSGGEVEGEEDMFGWTADFLALAYDVY